MKKAEQLFEILSHSYTKPIEEKYAKVVLKIATLEERIKVMMSFGMVDKAQELQLVLVELLEAIKKEFIDDENKKK